MKTLKDINLSSPESSGRINRSSGFTLTEVMAVVSIISILSLISLTAYADYKTRSKVVEGLGFVAKAKTAVTETYVANGVFPLNNLEAGLNPPESYDYKYFSRLEVGILPVPGSITLTVKDRSLGANNLLQLVPVVVNGELDWQCKPSVLNGISRAKVPAVCRG
jgi:type IV pilus assembly protein PilA